MKLRLMIIGDCAIGITGISGMITIAITKSPIFFIFVIWLMSAIAVISLLIYGTIWSK